MYNRVLTGCIDCALRCGFVENQVSVPTLRPLKINVYVIFSNKGALNLRPSSIPIPLHGRPHDNLSRNTRTTTLSDQKRASDSPCASRWGFLGSVSLTERALFLPFRGFLPREPNRTTFFFFQIGHSKLKKVSLLVL